MTNILEMINIKMINVICINLSHTQNMYCFFKHSQKKK